MQYNSVDELKNAIAANVWSNLSESAKNCLFQVLNRSGGHTNY